MLPYPFKLIKWNMRTWGNCFIMVFAMSHCSLFLISMPSSQLTRNFPGNPFWVDTLTTPNSFICYQINTNIKSAWISTHRHITCAIWRWLESGKKNGEKVGSANVFVVLGVHMRVSTQINGWHSNPSFA